MKIAFFGASGTVGQRVLRAAVDRGIEVKALVRTPQKLGSMADEIEVIQGDYFDGEKVSETIAGTDAVLSTLGPPVGWGHSVTPQDFEDGMRSVVRGMEEEGIRRIVALSSSATTYAGESLTLERKFFRLILSVHSPVMTPAKERELAVLMASDTDWTSIRPPMITDSVSGALRLDEHDKQGARVNTAQLVDLMLDSITSKEWSGKAPFVATG